MLRKGPVLLAMLLLLISSFIYAEDKSAAPEEGKPSFFGADKADKPARKKAKKSKGWYPYAKDKKWYSFIGQSGAPQAAQQPSGQEQAQEQKQEQKQEPKQQQK